MDKSRVCLSFLSLLSVHCLASLHWMGETIWGSVENGHCEDLRYVG